MKQAELSHTPDGRQASLSPPTVFSFTASKPSIMDNLDFLNERPAGGAQLILKPLKKTEPEVCIANLDLDIIQAQCSSLANAFRKDDRGFMTCTFDQTSTTAAICFMRWIYTNDYAICAFNDAIPPLLHLQIFRLALTGNVRNLGELVLKNLNAQADISTSSGFHPVELCDAIEFLYTNLPSKEGLVRLFTYYCLDNFINDQLKDHDRFKQTVSQLPKFHQDLCIASMDHEFPCAGAQDIAMDIMRMVVCEDSTRQNISTLGSEAQSSKIGTKELEEDFVDRQLDAFGLVETPTHSDTESSYGESDSTTSAIEITLSDTASGHSSDRSDGGVKFTDFDLVASDLDWATLHSGSERDVSPDMTSDDELDWAIPNNG